MTIWIDPPAWPAHGRLWSHLVSDTSYDELHEFAAAQGVPRRGFEGDHYDVPQERYAALVAAGAHPVDGRDLVRILRASGLRVQKRKHEKVIRTVTDASWLPTGSRVDVIASRQAEAPSTTVEVRLALVRDGALLVVDGSDGAPDLPARTVSDRTPAQVAAELGSDATPRPADRAAVLLGYVRNTVPHPDGTYPWPTPQASFAVYLDQVGPQDGRPEPGTGSWLDPAAAALALADRLWWPLVADLHERPR